MDAILVHYAELALKGANRRRFERRLISNLRHLFGVKVQREHGRMLLFTPDAKPVLEDLRFVPGIRYFARAFSAEPTIESMQQVALQAVRAEFGDDVRGKRFRVRARRADKRIGPKSLEIEREVGGFLKSKLGLVVNLDMPEIAVVVEVAAGGVWIYARRHEGAGGLPVGSSGRGVVLFSGGLDSPVAAFRMMKRGMRLDLAHFFNSSMPGDLAKIERLAARLSRWHGTLQLHLLDLEEFQRHAIAHVPADWRMVIYKRQMLRVACRLAQELGAQALVVGDSLGQVASQTLANIGAIYEASRLPVLAPLIGMDKEEIVRESERLGLYPISIEEHCDVCTFMLAKHPQTRADAERAAKLEALLPLDAMPPVRRLCFDRGQKVELAQASG